LTVADEGVVSVAFTADGKHVLSHSVDGTMRIWNTAGIHLPAQGFFNPIPPSRDLLRLEDGWIIHPTSNSPISKLPEIVLPVENWAASSTSLAFATFHGQLCVIQFPSEIRV